jgi:hypothetical protein
MAGACTNLERLSIEQLNEPRGDYPLTGQPVRIRAFKKVEKLGALNDQTKAIHKPRQAFDRYRNEGNPVVDRPIRRSGNVISSFFWNGPCSIGGSTKGEVANGAAPLNHSLLVWRMRSALV